ncbi:HlyD family efflux transporter periplasmic adaptor subunit [Treponema lecithinolyticum]|uniref:HlyD family efflux transporter periplasmic adaptor subunit n=1 Tax=Treponema lecithinolyticum TaxID=53418 RepID=UPI0028ED7FBB|nr:HlyD family efflux transporter periplasmic adaptor subunit [Treponema lecithinolyticum]
MKEPVVLIPIDQLSYSQEILLYEEPKILSLTIWIIAVLLSAAVCWVVFGKMEEVVRGKGLIRPISNISQVKNAVAGEITGLYYRPGQQVEKGDLLLQIDFRSLQAKEDALKVNYEKTHLKIIGLKQIEESFYSGTEKIDAHNKVALTRFEAYKTQKDLLQKKYMLSEKTWQEALHMPQESITPVKVRELEYAKNIAALNMEAHDSAFIKDISSEYTQSFIELEDLKSKLEQVRQSLKNASVYAPIDGTVQEISSLNKSDYLFTDQKILNIVPAGSAEYRAELKIPAKMSGKLQKGMKVKLRFPAFPFHEFGGAQGVITSIDPDASADSRGAFYFTVLVDINKAFLQDKKKNSYPIKSGLEVESRIILKEQTVLWYILKKFDLLW